jgi:hypothetical protein
MEDTAVTIAKKLLILSSAVLLIPSLSFAGTTLKSMDSKDVNSTFGDKTITTISEVTLNGEVVANNFTGYFGKDGKMKGQFAQKPSNDPQQDTGTWKVNSDGMFCFKWDHWDSNKERCVSMYKLKNAILVVNDQNGFETLIMEKDIKSGNQMQ